MVASSMGSHTFAISYLTLKHTCNTVEYVPVFSGLLKGCDYYAYNFNSNFLDYS